jgi:hypothetical protein
VAAASNVPRTNDLHFGLPAVDEWERTGCVSVGLG